MVAEVVAVLRGIILAIETGLTPFVVEIDALVVVNLIQGGKAPLADVGLIIAEILNKLNSVFGGFTISLNKLHLSINETVKFCYVIVFYTGFLCIPSIWHAIVVKSVSVKMVLDILSFPGAILLLFRASQGREHVDNDNIDGHYTLVQSGDNVTPFAEAGFFSTMSFWWLNPLVKKGNEQILEDKEIPELRKEDQAYTCYSIYMEQMNKRKQKLSSESDSPSMLSVILFCQWKTILVSGFFALIKVLALSSSPLFLIAFIKVASGKESFRYEAYALTGGLFLTKCFESLSERQWYFRTRLIGLQVRSLLSAAIYQKQLRLSNAAKLTYSSGEIVSYATVDAYKIGEFPYWFHQIWATSLLLCFALVFVYYSVGLATVAALITVLLVFLGSSPLTKLQHRYRIKLMIAQDRRLKAISEALANMKVLKLYAWETHFKNVIQTLRKKEFEWILKVLSLKGCYMVLYYSSPILIPAVTFWTCYFLSIPLNASNVFTFLASLRIAQEQIRMIPEVVGIFIEASISFSRIVKFLEAPELENTNTRQIKSDNKMDWSIFIRSAEISWDASSSSSSKATLRNIDLMVKPGEKVAICGEVGSGKSTLLASILGEVPNINGMVQVYGKIAYVSQTAWIQTGTIQENIMFGSIMDATRYQEVLAKSCLVKDLEMLPFGDLTEIGERGVNLSGGQKQRVQLARALYQDADVYLLDDPFSAVDAHTATALFNEYVMGALSRKTVLLITHQVDFLPAFDLILLMAGGKILDAATYDKLLDSTPEFQDLVDANKKTTGFERHFEFDSSTRPPTSEGEIKETNVGKQYLKTPSGDQLIKKEERETGDTGLKPYLQYLSHNKSFWYFFLQFVLHVLFLITQMIQSYWFAAEIQNSLVSRVKLITIYSVMGCVLPVLLLLRSFSIVILGKLTSESIFSTLLISLFRAPMSFHDSTPLGRILSRVSSDMSIVDTELAFHLSLAVGSDLNAYSCLLLLGILAWPVLIVSIPMIYFSILLQRYYFASAKELMRMNGTTKSSIASHLAESIVGATTIRAFRQEDGFFSKHLKLIDANACPYFHSSSADEWLVQRLEILCAIVLSSSALSMTLLPLGPSASGFIGMALSYGLSLNIFLICSAQNHCSAANFIVSTERLEQYMHIPDEAKTVAESRRPADNWPATGKLEIKNLKVRYRPDAPLVLRGISCIIEGGYKVGIVGRTGSGKTTLISALFRLVEPTDGEIIIDGLNISNVGLHDLRSHLGIIPQDPTLFSGTVRYNLDPLWQYTDHEIWEVLEKCHLREVIREKEEGLDSLVVEDGSNWSLGQRQLFCLGRALLKRSRILVLDEATASIDNATDSIIQKTIRREFADCTVITVAHRIPTVMDCNAVLAISDGRLVEYNEPAKLINMDGSLFGQLVKEYWSIDSVIGSLQVNHRLDSNLPISKLHLRSLRHNMEDGFWMAFCNKSECSNETAKVCSSGFSSIDDPYSCINHALIICIDILLLSICLFFFIYKLSTRKTIAPLESQKLPVKLIYSIIYNGILGLAYFGLGISIVSKKVHKDHSVLPLHKWLVLLFQGFTWLFLALTISLNKLHLPHSRTVKFCYIVIIYVGFVCISSLRKAILENIVSIKMILDILSFPGTILLLLCAFQGHGYADTDVDNCRDDSQVVLQGHGSNDKVTPFAEAGFFSNVSFWWLNPLMKKGKERILEDKDIPQLRLADQARTCYSIFMEQKGSSDSHSLLSVILLCQWKAILVSGFFALIKVITLSAGPLFLREFIKVASGKENIKYEAYVLTGGLFLAKCLESLSERQWFFRTRLIGLQVRSMLSAAIYQKQLRLSNTAKMTFSPGEIVSYITVDAYKIGEFPYWFHQMWTTCLQLCLALVIIYYCVGLATTAALITVLLTVLASSPLTKLQHKYQIKLMVAQDRRLKAITEALTNMKVLKLYAWETHFKNVIEGLRKEEFKWIYKVLTQKGYYVVLFWSSPILIPIVTFWACYFLKITPDASNAFTFLASLQIAQGQIRLIPEVAGIFIESKVSFSRIVKFLEARELENTNIRQVKSDRDMDMDWSIFIRSADISWDACSSSMATLRNINLMIKPREKVAICGEVGSGKSTLLAAILGEVPKISGMVSVYGKIAYVSQTAWIQTGTIQENILLGSAMDPTRFQEVLEKSCLVKDLEMLPFGDLTEIGERGVNLSGGQKQRVQLARALYQDADVYLLDDPFSAVDAHTATSLFNEYVLGALSAKTVLLVTHQVDFLPSFNLILLMAGGEILEATTYDKLLASTPEFQDLVNAHKNTSGSERHFEFSSSTKPVTSEGEIEKINAVKQLKTPIGDQLIKKEEREIGDTGLKPCLQYLRHKKGISCFSWQAVFLLLFVIGQLIQIYWLAANIQNSIVSRVKLIAGFSLIGCILPVLLLLRSFVIVVLGCNTSESIFSTLLSSLFRAPMSFYDSTPLGRILSRVSSDMSIIDIELVFRISSTLTAYVNAYTGFVILAILAWPVLFIIIPMIYLIIYIQTYYLSSAKELMRMNGTTKSSIASYLAESIAGATTIRAFGEEDGFFSKSLKLIDENACQYFHSSSADEWLIQRLEILCAIVLSSLALVMTLLPLVPSASASGLIGMALSYGLSLNVFLIYAIENHCLAANFIVSVERLEQYMHIPSEAQTVVEGKRPAHDWPAIGKVEIYNLKVKYRPNSPLVLRGISCVIEGGHKVGIVGRTGSGKTTLISVLFRLVEPTEGEIIIDDINITSIGLHDLRSHLAIIPQDPTLFSGSVRFNLDPLSQYTDHEIWEVLGKCHLREVIQEKEEGLDSLGEKVAKIYILPSYKTNKISVAVMEGGSNWSMGQRQLFCLGRAILKRSRILVLDEATASIDNATDRILQKTIRREFADSTVITVAHRIPTVMDCNAVIAISDGELVEYDEPVKLINKEGSLFGQLVKDYLSHTTTYAQ
ncbi:hypothetical protein LWI28_019508 [Acer negundo]|uniref:ABC-type xenobiotic transporter n=1 Tax=Acer negundo TaxID=4023 RepID=A0AAD5NQF1_ACENE|nr:hypothetical protein LWI28_019508 [Acer negundo]